MKSNTTTHINARREESKRLQAFVMECLGWSEYEYCLFKYEQGLEYLRAYLTSFHIDHDMLRFMPHIERQRIYWQWWKNQWMLRDSIFEANMINDNRSQERKVRIYKGFHNGNSLVNEITPQRSVLNEDAMKVFKEIDAELEFSKTVNQL